MIKSILSLVSVLVFSCPANADTPPARTILGLRAGSCVGFVKGTAGTLSCVSSTAPTGTPNYFAKFDGSGNLTASTIFQTEQATKGLLTNFDYAHDNSANGYLLNLNWNIYPTENSHDVYNFGIQNNVYIGNAFKSGSYVGFTNIITRGDVGDMTNTHLEDQSLMLGDGTNISTSEDSELLNLYLEIRDNHTVQDDTHMINQHTTTNTGSVVEGSVRGFENYMDLSGTEHGAQLFGSGANINTDMSTDGGFSAFQSGSNIAAKIQYFDGFNLGTNFNNGAHIVNGISSYTDSSHIYSGALADEGMSSYASYITMDSGSTVNGYTGVQINPNINAAMGTNGFTGVGVFPNLGGSVNFYNGYEGNLHLTSTGSVTNGIEALSAGIHIDTGGTARYISGLNTFSEIETGVHLENYTGIQASLKLDGTSTADDARLGNFYFDATTQVVTHVHGIQISMDHINSPNQKEGLTINDGSLNVNSNYDTAILDPAPTEFQLNNLGGSFHIAAGFPMHDTFGFGNNAGGGFFAEDNMGVDPFGGLLGYSLDGFVGQFGVAAGKTVDRFNMLTVGGSIPQGSGTITHFTVINLLGGLPQGGTISSPTVIGIEMQSFLCSLSSDKCYGLYIPDAAAQNYFAGEANADKGFRLSTSGSQPTCSTDTRGLTWNIQGGTGVADLFQVCQKDASDTYAWSTK